MDNISLDNLFILSGRLLQEPERQWRVRDFLEEGIKKDKVSTLFKILDREDIIERPINSGRNSYSILKSVEQLLQYCSERFVQHTLKTISFHTTLDIRTTALKLENYGFEVYRGGLSSIPTQYQHVVQNRSDLICASPSFFTRKSYQRLLYDLDIHRVYEGGNLFITYPRFKKFLRYGAVRDNETKIPSDFYTYLSLKHSTLPMATVALDNLINASKNEGVLFG